MPADQARSGVAVADQVTDQVTAGITIGVTGLRPRWSVSPWGSVTAWETESEGRLDWFVAADDRWHVPADEPTVRQLRIEGTPVVETRLRVPDGDAVQRVWAVPEHGGMVVMEFENESPKPFAIALTGAHIITERDVADVAIEGIDLPDDAIVMPVGHRAIVRVAMPHPDSTDRPLRLPVVPPQLAVVRGWTRVVEQASRMVLPDEALVEAVVAARCDLLLEGPVDAVDDPAGFLLDVAELVRCGDSADAWMVDMVAPAEAVAAAASGGRRSGLSGLLRRNSTPDSVSLFDAREAILAARVVAMAAGDERATADLDRMAARIVVDRSADTSVDDGAEASSFASLRRGASVGRFVRSVERRLADGGVLLPGGIPTGWLGTNFEVHAIPTGAGSSVSYAVRWHGERPAVLWEQHGAEVAISAPDLNPDWSTTEPSGETLWLAPEAPERVKPKSIALKIDIDPDGASFS